MFCKTCGHKWDAENGVVCPSCGSRFVAIRVSWASVLLLVSIILGLSYLLNSALW